MTRPEGRMCGLWLYVESSQENSQRCILFSQSSHLEGFPVVEVRKEENRKEREKREEKKKKKKGRKRNKKV